MKLKSVYNLTVNHKKIRRIMTECGLRSVIRPKYRKGAAPDSLVLPNLMARDFKAAGPGSKARLRHHLHTDAKQNEYLSAVVAIVLTLSRSCF
jgi:hypothetical protein